MNRLCVIALLLFAIALGAEPAWYGTYGTTQEEIIGHGAARVENKDEATARATAEQDAIYDISRQIFSEVRAFSQNTETEGFENTQFSVKDVQIESCVSLCNAKVVKGGADKGFYYAVVSVRRSDLVRHYLAMVESGVDDVISTFGGMEALMRDNPKEAIRRLTSLRASLDDLSRNAKILNAVYSSGVKSIVPRISEVPRIQQVDGYIAELTGNMRYSYGDITDNLLAGLKPELKKPQSFSLSYIEWLNTGFTSEFSVAYSEYLGMELEKRLGWSKVSGSARPAIAVSGQLIEEGGAVNLIVRFNGAANQTLSVLLTPATIAYIGADKLRPKDLEAKLKDRDMLLKESIQSNKLQVMAKFMEFGRNPAVLYLGDTANIYIRANKACYITVINVEANGDKNVLVQNQRISPDVINEWIPLTGTFRVTPPTGVEQILLQADLNRLPEIDTRPVMVEGGTKYIATGLPASLSITRGLVMETPASEYTEDYLTWTVLER